MSWIDDYYERSAKYNLPFIEEFAPKGFLAMPSMFIALIGMLISPQYEACGKIMTALGFVASAVIWGSILYRTFKRIAENEKKQ